MSLKNQMTSPGIDPGTARLVAQRIFTRTMLKIKKSAINIIMNGKMLLHSSLKIIDKLFFTMFGYACKYTNMSSTVFDPNRSIPVNVVKI
jgi:hypothetical protein